MNKPINEIVADLGQHCYVGNVGAVINQAGVNLLNDLRQEGHVLVSSDHADYLRKMISLYRSGEFNESSKALLRLASVVLEAFGDE